MLTAEERVGRLQQLADNEVRAVQEQARLEDEQSKLFGIAVPSRSFEDMVREASSYWLTPPMLASLVANYLEALVGCAVNYVTLAWLGRQRRVSSQGPPSTRTALRVDHCGPR